MITRVDVANFKPFGSLQSAPFAPLTLIFGPNSGGKTSLLQVLLLLKQTRETQESHEVLVPKGNLVDLGGFLELVHRHRAGADVEIGVLCDESTAGLARPRRLAGPDRISSQAGVRLLFRSRGRPPVVRLHEVRVFRGDSDQPLMLCSTERVRPGPSLRAARIRDQMATDPPGGIRTLRFRSTNPDHPIWQETWGRMMQDARKKRAFIEKQQATREFCVRSVDRWASINRGEKASESSRDSLESASRAVARIDRLMRALNTGRWQSVLRELANNWKNQYVLIRGTTLAAAELDLLDDKLSPHTGTAEWLPHGSAEFRGITSNGFAALSATLDSLTYIGPLRQSPERYYIYGGNTPALVGSSGKGVPVILMAKPQVTSRVNGWFDRLGIRYRLRVKRFRSGSRNQRDLFALSLMDRETRTDSCLPDVGFGVSQLLPVIVQCVAAAHETILVEQPEIHLHPALQAELGDLFIESALGGQGNQLVIETHSEHLLLRLMRRMRETHRNARGARPPVRPEDVSVLYVQKESKGSRILHLRLDRDGNLLDPWPGGFFEEGFRERFS